MANIAQTYQQGVDLKQAIHKEVSSTYSRTVKLITAATLFLLPVVAGAVFTSALSYLALPLFTGLAIHMIGNSIVEA